KLAEGIGVAAGHPGHEASIFTRLIAGYEVIGRHGSPTWSRPYGPGAVDTRLLRRPPDPTRRGVGSRLRAAAGSALARTHGVADQFQVCQVGVDPLVIGLFHSPESQTWPPMALSGSAVAPRSRPSDTRRVPTSRRRSRRRV